MPLVIPLAHFGSIVSITLCDQVLHLILRRLPFKIAFCSLGISLDAGQAKGGAQAREAAAGALAAFLVLVCVHNSRKQAVKKIADFETVFWQQNKGTITGVKAGVAWLRRAFCGDSCGNMCFFPWCACAAFLVSARRKRQ